MFTLMSQPERIEDSTGYRSIDDSLDNPDTLGYEPQLYAMGGAVIGNDGKSYVSPDSDNRYAHEREAGVMKRVVHDYLDSKVGQEFVNYAQQKGKKFIPIVGIGTKDMGQNTVAAIITNDLEAILVSNYDGKGIKQRAAEMAQAYGVMDTQMMLDYVLTHELAHAAGHQSEAETESFVKDFYTDLAAKSNGAEREKYLTLAGIAAVREEQAYKSEAN